MKFIKCNAVSATLLMAGFLSLAQAQEKVLITEFMAANRTGLKDQFGQASDWIEIFNAGTNAVNLEGWYLTDNAGDLRKWSFPATNLNANSHLIVFASGTDTRVIGQPLHTSFLLSAGGEYLALVKPDGTNVVSAFAPVFPPQFNDISFGMSTLNDPVLLISTNSPVRVFVPTNDDLVTSWVNREFNDASWTAGTNGVGYDNNAAEPGQSGSVAYSGLLRTDIRAAMSNVNASAYLRIPFQLGNPGEADALTLRMKYDDGFVAYLNGTEVLRRNAPSAASAGRVADFSAEYSGTQGLNNWYYGYYNATADTNGVYNPGDLLLFTDNYWNGSAWDLTASGAPWTTVGAQSSHPNGNNSGNIHWAVARWVSEANGAVTVTINLRKQNTAGGNGTTGKLLVNGVEKFTYAIGGTDGVGITTNLTITGVNVGDYFDFALTPRGPDGADGDSSDGTFFYFTIDQLPGADLTWNSSATGLHLDSQAVVFEDFDLTPFARLLESGTNVLAIHGLNVASNNVDFLLLAELQMRSLLLNNERLRYFLTPSPGALNTFGTATLGARISDVTHYPLEPREADDLVITARITPTFDAITNVTLTYRIMFLAEANTPMRDDGLGGDQTANDGLFTAVIPASLSTTGQMVRWFVSATDASGIASRWPLFENPTLAPKYLGTIIVDPALTSNLPILHWFVENPAAANNDTGTRASIYYNRQFLDNIGVTLHGQSSSGFPKKSYNFNLNSSYKVEITPDMPKMSDFALLSTWADRIYVRNSLASETYIMSGLPAHFTFPIRVHQNGAYFSLANFMEQGNNEYLDRIDFDPNGALYKIYNTITTVSGNEKKTRKWDSTADLQTLVTAVNSTDANTYLNFIYDNVNLPSVANFIATKAIASDHDCCHKNYYLYRDSDGTGEWYHLPWDMDLSFGHKWSAAPQGNYFDDTITTNVGPYVGGNSILLGRVLGDATLKSLVARRLRTLMDQIQQPPGTLPQNDRLRSLILWHTEQVRAEAALDRAKWGIATWVAPTYGPANPSSSFDVEIDRVNNFFLEGYRKWLFQANTANGQIPAAQPAATFLRFGAIEVNPSSANQDQEYLELLNTNTYAADISGWRINGGINFTFAEGTVVPANGKIYVSPNVLAFRARTTGPRAGQRLVVVGPYQGRLSTRGENLSLLNNAGEQVHAVQTTNSASLAQQFLRVTELMYNPPAQPGDTNDVDQYEYLELRNISTNTAINLNGVRFTTGIAFDFTGGAITNLAPGERVLIVKNPALFAARYGAGLPVAGAYLGNLDNGGETLRLDDPSNEKILEFAYNDNWYPVTDGFGYALAIVDDTAHWSSWDLKQSWQPSGQLNGTPAQPKLAPPIILPVLVNEVLARPVMPGLDWIELHNPNPVDVNLGGWFLSDDFRTPKKFRIPDGTTIASNGFLVFNENQFNAPTNANRFALGAKGDSTYLFSADAQGNLTGYYHGFDFGGSRLGESFGRHTLLSGEDRFLALATNTPGAANAGPIVGPVIIHEIMYHPPELVLYNLPYENQRDEYIELRNVSTNTIALNDPTQPNGAWRLRDAVAFNFPTNAILAPDGYLLVVSFNPQDDPVSLNAFLARYNLPPNTPIFGPYDGQLGNDNDSVELVRIETYEDSSTDEVVMDKVRYSDSSPWPCGSDGNGNSLQRLLPETYGNDPALWIAKPPTPAAPNPNQAPGLASIVSQPSEQWVTTGSAVQLKVEACASGVLFYQWQRDGVDVSGATNSSLFLGNLTTNESGYYSVILSNFNGAITSTPALLAVQNPPVISLNPQSQVVTGFTSVAFTVAAGPTPPFRYQWRRNGADLAGATNQTLEFPSVLKSHEGNYSVLVWNAAGQALSSAATLSVNVPARVLAPLLDVVTNNSAGARATFAPAIAGDAPMTYQWYFSNAPLAAATNASLTLTNVQASNNGPYYIVISNLYGMDTSTVAQLTVRVRPKFLTGPSNVVVTAGETLRLNASLSEGETPVTYLWRRGATYLATNVTSEYTAEFAVVRALPANGGFYSLSATNVATSSSGISAFAGVAVVVPPEDRQALAGSNLNLRADVGVGGTVVYQWQLAGTNVPGANKTNLVVANLAPERAGTYRLMVSNSPTQIRWYECVVELQAVATAPAITQQPTNLTIQPLENALFLAAASGTDPLFYQWQFNGADLSGATNRYLGLPNAASAQVGLYQLIVSNSLGVATSAVATLNFATPPEIAQQPTNQAVNQGQTASFTVVAIGADPLGYQWRREGTNLAGQTAATLSLASAQPADAGAYDVVVSNIYGMVTSAVATLTVTVANQDTDGDGIPDAWETANGLTVGVNDALVDSDGDGLSNLQEYLAGTDPQSAASVLKLALPAGVTGGELTLRFNAVSNRSYTLEYKGSLTNPAWQTLLTLDPAGSNRLIEVTNALGTNVQRYFRLGVGR